MTAHGGSFVSTGAEGCGGTGVVRGPSGLAAAMASGPPKDAPSRATRRDPWLFIHSAAVTRSPGTFSTASGTSLEEPTPRRSGIRTDAPVEAESVSASPSQLHKVCEEPYEITTPTGAPRDPTSAAPIRDPSDIVSVIRDAPFGASEHCSLNGASARTDVEPPQPRSRKGTKPSPSKLRRRRTGSWPFTGSLSARPDEPKRGALGIAGVHHEVATRYLARLLRDLAAVV